MILLRFWAYKIALISDIKQAHLNVEANEGERKFLRYLWIDNMKECNQSIITYQFTCVLFGLGPAQFLLVATITKHLIENYKDDREFVAKFLRDPYIDDSISGAHSSDAAFQLSLKSKYRLSQAGMSLRKWHSSDPELQRRLEQSVCVFEFEPFVRV